jgi:hypothetical protein
VQRQALSRTTIAKIAEITRRLRAETEAALAEAVSGCLFHLCLQQKHDSRIPERRSDWLHLWLCFFDVLNLQDRKAAAALADLESKVQTRIDEATVSAKEEAM